MNQTRPKEKEKARRPGDKIFAADLKARREALGWTAAQMADALGLSVRGYLKYERAESAPPQVMREGILARLNCYKHAPAPSVTLPKRRVKS
jgi:transcriptional regulator with XRE-family HTH domain